MSPDLQKKLLRVLEDGRVRPVGAKTPVQVDVRLVCSTSRDLEKLVRQGKFRRDLYYRLKGAVLEIPPLRERREDVLPLAIQFLQSHARKENCPPPVLAESAHAAFLKHSWPGNTRELENEMRRLVALGHATIRAEDLYAGLGRQGKRRLEPSGLGGLTLQDAVAQAEREAILNALRLSRGNKSKTAQALGVTRKALYRRMSKYGISGESAL
jgi:transcriptional regulator with PAS, ATPase and Fis domain